MSDNKPFGKKKSKGNRKGLFSFLDKGLKLDTLFQTGPPLKVIPYILFVAAMGIIYIGNTHYSESLDKNYKEMSMELEGMKAHYNTLKADYMFQSKQTEVAEKLEPTGLTISNVPPKKILVKKGEY